MELQVLPKRQCLKTRVFWDVTLCCWGLFLEDSKDRAAFISRTNSQDINSYQTPRRDAQQDNNVVIQDVENVRYQTSDFRYVRLTATMAVVLRVLHKQGWLKHCASDDAITVTSKSATVHDVVLREMTPCSLVVEDCKYSGGI
jgi:hypothetical protein